jgi:hypothetical protein
LEPRITNAELYINNIFVNPEIHDIYIKRIGFSLVRVFRVHTQDFSTKETNILLSQLKWPVEYMFVGVQPTWNISASTGNDSTTAGYLNNNINVWRDWHRYTRQVTASITETSVCEEPTAAFNASTTIRVDKVEADTYHLDVPTIDSFSLSSHGIVIFDNLQDKFFNEYMPFHYGGGGLRTPEDVGVLFVNMALYPTSEQPSGHLNISRARETYAKVVSSYVDSSTPARFVAVAVALNFLLITDGSAVLRYST